LHDVASNLSGKIEPTSNYRDKYNHIIGTSAAKDAAKKTEANKSFGMGKATLYLSINCVFIFFRNE